MGEQPKSAKMWKSLRFPEIIILPHKLQPTYHKRSITLHQVSIRKLLQFPIKRLYFKSSSTRSQIHLLIHDNYNKVVASQPAKVHKTTKQVPAMDFFIKRLLLLLILLLT